MSALTMLKYFNEIKMSQKVNSNIWTLGFFVLFFFGPPPSTKTLRYVCSFL